jgi:AcrR family transcriptional regulator
MKRKERIVLTAIEIIHELGYQGLTIKEICKRQNVSEGALYKHYKSKKEIVLAVVNYYSKYDEDIKQLVNMMNLSVKESINFYITRFAEYYETYPAMTAIFNSKEILKHEEGISGRVIDVFEAKSSFLTYLIESGKNTGQINTNIDSEVIADIILGSCRGITLKWRLRNFNFPLKERILSANELILGSI